MTSATRCVPDIKYFLCGTFTGWFEHARYRSSANVLLTKEVYVTKCLLNIVLFIHPPLVTFWSSTTCILLYTAQPYLFFSRLQELQRLIYCMFHNLLEWFCKSPYSGKWCNSRDYNSIFTNIYITTISSLSVDWTIFPSGYLFLGVVWHFFKYYAIPAQCVT